MDIQKLNDEDKTDALKLLDMYFERYQPTNPRSVIAAEKDSRGIGNKKPARNAG